MEFKNNKDEVPFEHYLQKFQEMDPEDAVRRLEIPLEPRTASPTSGPFSSSVLQSCQSPPESPVCHTPISTSQNPPCIFILSYFTTNRSLLHEMHVSAHKL